jgi:hypothetical protein
MESISLIDSGRGPNFDAGWCWRTSKYQARTDPYTHPRSTAEAMLGGALTGFWKGWGLISWPDV